MYGCVPSMGEVPTRSTVLSCRLRRSRPSPRRVYLAVTTAMGTARTLRQRASQVGSLRHAVGAVSFGPARPLDYCLVMHRRTPASMFKHPASTLDFFRSSALPGMTRCTWPPPALNVLPAVAVRWSGTTYTGARSLAGSRAPSRAASRVQRVAAGGSTALSASNSRSKVRVLWRAVPRRIRGTATVCVCQRGRGWVRASTGSFHRVMSTPLISTHPFSC